MRVSELYEPGRFRIAERALEAPAPGEIQVRVDAVGICGSDLHYFTEGGIGDAVCVYPTVLGHEPTGTVVNTGAGVSGWQPGDRAALEPALYCYHCEFCRTGHHNLCANIRFLSSPPDPGFFREIVNLPAVNLLPLPPEVDSAAGTLFEPLAVALHSMKFAAPALGEEAIVFGAGPIGLLTIILLRLSRAGRIWAVDPVAGRRALALVAGADAALDPSEVAAETRGRGADLAIDCASGDGSSTSQAIDATRSAGRVVVTGIPSGNRVSLDFHTMRRKELVLYHVRRSNHESEAALDLLRRMPERFAPLITHRVPLDSVERAFTMLVRHEEPAGKVVVQP